MQTNDAKNTHTTLTCKCKALVATRLKTDPPSPGGITSLNFGKLGHDAEATTKTVTITRGDGGPIAPELINTNDPVLKTAIREIKAGEEYALDVTMTPPWPAQNPFYHGAVSFKTGLTNAPTDVVMVQAQFDPRLQAEPGRLIIPTDAQAEAEVKSRLVWGGSKPGKVVKVLVNDPALSVRVDEDDKGQFVVLTAPTNYQQRIATFVTVETDDKQVPTVRIPVVRIPTRPPTTRAALAPLPGGPRRPTTRPIAPAVAPTAETRPAQAQPPH